MEWNGNENDQKKQTRTNIRKYRPKCLQAFKAKMKIIEPRPATQQSRNLGMFERHTTSSDKFSFQQRKWMTQLEHQVANKSLNENREQFASQIWQNINNKNIPKSSFLQKAGYMNIQCQKESQLKGHF